MDEVAKIQKGLFNGGVAQIQVIPGKIEFNKLGETAKKAEIGKLAEFQIQRTKLGQLRHARKIRGTSTLYLKIFEGIFEFPNRREIGDFRRVLNVKTLKIRKVLQVGETGEIIASMNSLDAFTGYWKRPDANKKAIRHGWYFTGDLGKFDENGEIYVLGRVDDMIISGGENIYAEEVENVLAKSPDVLGVAVIGIEDDRWGERVSAFIEPATDGVSPKKLDAYCLESGLARFKRPRAYAFIKAIPRSASGKLLRRHLRTGDFVLLTEYENTI